MLDRVFLRKRKLHALRSRSHERGYTLIELLVAGSVFVMVFLGASTVFVLTLRAQRESLSDIRVIDSGRAAMESMVRTIRTVNEVDILDPAIDTNDPIPPTAATRSSISFIHNGKVGGLGCPIAPCEVTYWLDVASGTLYETNRTPGTGGGEVFPLTGEGVAVSAFNVIVRGRGNCDSEPPRITLALQVAAEESPGDILPLASTVTLRPLEICS